MLDLVINEKATLGENIVCRDIRKKMKFENGKPTDTVDCYVHSCVLLDRKYENIDIKTEKPLFDPETQSDRIADMVNVGFKGLTIKPFVMNGKMGITAKAEEIYIVNEKKGV